MSVLDVYACCGACLPVPGSSLACSPPPGHEIGPVNVISFVPSGNVAST